MESIPNSADDPDDGDAFVIWRTFSDTDIIVTTPAPPETVFTTANGIVFYLAGNGSDDE